MNTKRIIIVGINLAFVFAILWIGQSTLTSAANLEAKDTTVSNPQPNIITGILSGTNIVSETFKLASSFPITDGRYGRSVAIHGDTLVVGEDNGSNASIGSGVVGHLYIHERHAGGTNNWGVTKVLTPSDGPDGHGLGTALAFDGNTLLAGATTANGNATESGAAYIFERNHGGADNWGEVTKLIAPDGAYNDRFGWAVALDGDTAVVGARWHDSGRGSAYIYERNEGGPNNWGFVKEIVASNRVSGDVFGVSVAINENTIFVGASEKNLNGTHTGLVYVFERDEGGTDNWGEVRQIAQDSPLTYDAFGASLATEGNFLAVGAPEGSTSRAGAVYIFERDTGGPNNWGQIDKITPSDGHANGRFSSLGLAMQGGTILVGAHHTDGLVNHSGTAYVFEQDPMNLHQWSETAKLVASDGAMDDEFGITVSLFDNTIAVGSYRDDDYCADDPTCESGSAYIYTDLLSIPDLDVIYDPSTGNLPEDFCPPWTRLETGTPNEPVIINEQLVLSTTTNNDNLWYSQTDINFIYPIIIEGRVRWESGSSSNAARTPIALGVTTAPDVGNTLYIGQDQIFLLDGYLSMGDSAVVDTDDNFHDYRIEIDVLGNVQVFYDGALTLSGTTFNSNATHGPAERIIWGDVSSFARGVSEWERVAHNALVTDPCIADVSISKAVSDATAVPNQPITYTLTYTNNGPGIAYNTIITDVVPQTIINPAFSSSGPLITPTISSTFVWDVAPLSPGETGLITITGIISPELTLDTTIVNTAVIHNSADITSTNDVDTAVVAVSVPKLLYLPLVVKPAPDSFPIQIGEAIAIAPTIPGVTFYTATVVMPSNIPTTGQFFLSAQPDQISPIWVDDELVISLNNNELFTKLFSPNCQPVQAESVAMPREVVAQLAGNSPTFIYRDACGNNVGASTVWLIWVP